MADQNVIDGLVGQRAGDDLIGALVHQVRLGPRLNADDIRQLRKLFEVERFREHLDVHLAVGFELRHQHGARHRLDLRDGRRRIGRIEHRDRCAGLRDGIKLDVRINLIGRMIWPVPLDDVAALAKGGQAIDLRRRSPDEISIIRNVSDNTRPCGFDSSQRVGRRRPEQLHEMQSTHGISGLPQIVGDDRRRAAGVYLSAPEQHEIQIIAQLRALERLWSKLIERLAADFNQRVGV